MNHPANFLMMRLLLLPNMFVTLPAFHPNFPQGEVEGVQYIPIHSLICAGLPQYEHRLTDVNFVLLNVLIVVQSLIQELLMLL